MFQSLFRPFSPNKNASKSTKREKHIAQAKRRTLRIENLESRLAFHVSFGGFQESLNFGVSRIAVDSLGNTYRAGGYSATLDLDPNSSLPNNADILSLPSGKTSIGYISKYDQSGSILWVRTVLRPISILTQIRNGFWQAHLNEFDDEEFSAGTKPRFRNVPGHGLLSE